MDIDLIGIHSSCAAPPANEVHGELDLTDNIVLGCLVFLHLVVTLFLLYLMIEDIEKERKLVVPKFRCSSCIKGETLLCVQYAHGITASKMSETSKSGLSTVCDWLTRELTYIVKKHSFLSFLGFCLALPAINILVAVKTSETNILVFLFVYTNTVVPIIVNIFTGFFLTHFLKNIPENISSSLPEGVVVQTLSSGNDPSTVPVHELSKSDRESLLAVLQSVVSSSPAIAVQLVALTIMNKSDFNLADPLLPLEGSKNEYETSSFRTTETVEPLQQLSTKSEQLIWMLIGIPDKIVDRKTFLETVKEVARTIEEVLESVAGVSALVSHPNAKRVLEQRKREFVKYSTTFLIVTLKDCFEDGLEQRVCTSTLNLIKQTKLIMDTVKESDA